MCQFARYAFDFHTLARHYVRLGRWSVSIIHVVSSFEYFIPGYYSQSSDQRFLLFFPRPDFSISRPIFIHRRTPGRGETDRGAVVWNLSFTWSLSVRCKVTVPLITSIIALSRSSLSVNFIFFRNFPVFLFLIPFYFFPVAFDFLRASTRSFPSSSFQG